VAGTLLLLFMVWCGYRAWSVAHALDSMAREAEVMKAALGRGDVATARKTLAAYQDAGDAADSRTSGPTWALLEHVPLLGDDAQGVAAASSVLHDIGERGLPPVVGAAAQVTGNDFQPKGHRFPLARIAAMVGPAKSSEAAFADAAGRLGEVDSSGFIGPFRARFDALRTLVDSSRDILGSTYRAARMMPDLLGAHGPRNYLLIMDNNAELRSLGGLSGSVTMVHAQNGAVHIAEQDDMADLKASPSMHLTADEKRLFGDLLRATGVNATMTPDAPRAAELVKARWELAHGGRVDGVFFVDPVAISYLMQGIGPVAVPGYPSISWSTVVAAVENQAYIVTTDRNAQSDFQNAVAKAVFNAFADGHGNPVTAIRGLARGVEEGRVHMTSFVKADQAQVAGTAIAGELPTKATVTPHAGVYINDSTQAKMSYYLQYSVSLASRSCSAGLQNAVGTMTMTSATPPDVGHLPVTVTGLGDPSLGIARGDQYVVVYLTSPIGGTITSLSVDGKEVPTPALVPFMGRQVATTGVRLDPRSTHTIQWGLQSGLRQTGAWKLAVTPGAQPGTQSATVPSSC
jgi:hypothetical protein